MIILRVPYWGFNYMQPGGYWGWRHIVTIGPWLIFWGRMTDRELDEWEGVE